VARQDLDKTAIVGRFKAALEKMVACKGGFRIKLGEI
jgi:hypothetical protein